MENKQEISWDNLMSIIDYTNFNSKIEGDILNEEVNLIDCVNSKISYKRNHSEMMSFSTADSHIFSREVNGKKIKYK